MTRHNYGDQIRRRQGAWHKNPDYVRFDPENQQRNGGERDNNSLNSFNSCHQAERATAASVRVDATTRAFPKMADIAFTGLAGDIVRLIGPHSESDSVALLLNAHAAFGNAIGRGPYYRVEGDRHCTNLFVLQVGDTAKARKGTGVGRIRQLFTLVDPEWEAGRIRNALGSGEGVIWDVRDPITKQKDGAEETIDAGVTDKRLMIFASEFASLLTVLQREGSILSSVLRDAWDRGDLTILTKHNQARATGALISIVAHITRDELVKHLHETEMSSGFANRFLFACVKRARLLPFGGDLDDEALGKMADRVKEAIAFAKETVTEAGEPKEIGWSIDGGNLWKEVYPRLTAERSGLLGALTARADPQVIRLALLYALWDQSYNIEERHLRAALAVWDYCEASVSYLFGDKLGNGVADAILSALRGSPNGLTRTDISAIFNRNVVASKIALALEELARLGLATRNAHAAGRTGRPTETWFAT